MVFGDYITLGTAVADFIDYALGVVSILIVYYFIRLIIGPGTANAAGNAEGNRGWGGINWGRLRGNAEERRRNRDLDREHQQLVRNLHGVLVYLHNIENHARQMDRTLRVRSDAAFVGANHHLNDIIRNANSLVAALHAARRHFNGDLRNHIQEMEHWADQHIEHFIYDEIRARMPRNAVARNWNVRVRTVRNNLIELITRCGNLQTTIGGLSSRDAGSRNWIPLPGVGGRVGPVAPGGGRPRPRNPPRHPY